MNPLQKFERAGARHLELERLLADPTIIADQGQYQKFAKEYSDLTPLVAAFKEGTDIARQIKDLESLLHEDHDKEFEALAKAELEDLRERHKKILERLEDLANPKPAEKDRPLIMEIRAGTGGQEAGLFAAEDVALLDRQRLPVPVKRLLEPAARWLAQGGRVGSTD